MDKDRNREKVRKQARILFAAPRSGSGKTLAVCGLIEVLKRRGLKVSAAKCGPDYIDPMFHRSVLGVPSGNLDTFFTKEETVRYLLRKRMEKADFTVIEGVMGYYDGLGGQSEAASTYEIAGATRTPVVLVVDGKGASVSLAAVIKGIAEYRPDSNLKGILLNRVTASFYPRLKEMVERECGIPVVGFLQERKQLEVPSRHLGLAAPEEMEDFGVWLQNVAAEMEKNVEIDKLLAIGEEAPEIGGEAPEVPVLPGKVRIGVARDEAFSFYYTENLELLARMGAELVEFSPLHDRELPPRLDGLLIGGGYPENYARELEQAKEIREAVKELCGRGIPCLAECGGFLYLQQALETAESAAEGAGSLNGSGSRTSADSEEGTEGTNGSGSRTSADSEEGTEGTNDPESRAAYRSCRMAGVLPGKGFPTGRLCRFGYIQVEMETPGILGGAGQILKGHEFHYWDSTENGTDCRATKPAGGKSYPCMVHTAHMAAGFPHLYYYSNPEAVFGFLQGCLRYQAGSRAQEHWDSIAKPIDGLGLLETYVTKLCRIAASPVPPNLKKRALLVLCGDHGVVAEGVTQCGSEVTKTVVGNLVKGSSTVNIMAECAGADVYVVDAGIAVSDGTGRLPAADSAEKLLSPDGAGRFSAAEKPLVPGVLADRRVGNGCGNIVREAAMTVEQCREALRLGQELVRELKEKGYTILATGEMGIGNTTPTSVLAALLLGKSPEEVTGRGAGLDQEGLRRKREAVRLACERTRKKILGEQEPIGRGETAKQEAVERKEQEGRQEPIERKEQGVSEERSGQKEPAERKKWGRQETLELLAEAGGFEIAMMAGVFLGGVRFGIPIVADGAISAVAALAASRLDSRTPDFLLASHVSEEAAGRLALEALGEEAILHGRMHLGEGTGAVALFPLLDMAAAIYGRMGSFEDYGIEAYERLS
ncbi:MAG: cobyrinate a,c-diamide synthase [Roseburia sp.]|nr:cobyrinate a,c-diamide synthase [Roseburia sp.]MCM1097847.1 cobyrinate a,c-diamide synthase [Ruminococcus flavefaciens]